MVYIEVIHEDRAQGLLKREYGAAEKRAGKVADIVKVMSQNLKTLQLSMRLYGGLMFDESPLSRAQREMLGVVVSATNQCSY